MGVMGVWCWRGEREREREREGGGIFRVISKKKEKFIR